MAVEVAWVAWAADTWGEPFQMEVTSVADMSVAGVISEALLVAVRMSAAQRITMPGIRVTHRDMVTAAVITLTTRMGVRVIITAAMATAIRFITGTVTAMVTTVRMDIGVILGTATMVILITAIPLTPR